jgi:hypothetical protein
MYYEWYTGKRLRWEDAEDVDDPRQQAKRIRRASELGRIEEIKALISEGADLRAQEDYAIRAASEQGHVEVVKLLLAAGASAEPKWNGWNCRRTATPPDWLAHRAFFRGHFKVARVLEAHGCAPRLWAKARERFVGGPIVDFWRRAAHEPDAEGRLPRAQRIAYERDFGGQAA